MATERPHRPPTLATVAAALGVSRMTVSNAYNRPDQLSPALRERRVPYVLVDFATDPSAHAVNVDDRGGAHAIAEHLVGLGHRAFGIILPFDKPGATGAEAEAKAVWHMHAQRLAGWRGPLEAAGVDWDAVPVATAPGGD